jgi:hypothetical protein
MIEIFIDAPLELQVLILVGILFIIKELWK